MKTLFITFLVFALSSTLGANVDSQKLLEDKCSSCHMLNSSTKIKQTKISAPPMWGIMRTLRDNIKTDKEGIAFIVDYVKYPSEKKMLFPKATKEHFGIMPSLKDDVNDEQLKALAELLYKDY